MHEVLVNRLGGLSLPRKSVVRLTDRPDMTLDVYRGRKTTKQQSNSRLSLSRNRRDPQKQFEISVLRHIRFVVLRKKTIGTTKFYK